jgi:hypothetical protein
VVLLVAFLHDWRSGAGLELLGVKRGKVVIARTLKKNEPKKIFQFFFSSDSFRFRQPLKPAALEDNKKRGLTKLKKEKKKVVLKR